MSFKEDVYELAFGDNAINKGYSDEEVLVKLREFSDLALLTQEDVKPSYIVDNFISYCNEDNEKLAKDVKCWLADYFGLKNRCVDLGDYEVGWIRENLTKKSQIEIFGKEV